eukprot:7768369-Pyramimonas_sp.AAC.1
MADWVLRQKVDRTGEPTEAEVEAMAAAAERVSATVAKIKSEEGGAAAAAALLAAKQVYTPASHAVGSRGRYVPLLLTPLARCWLTEQAEMAELE